MKRMITGSLAAWLAGAGLTFAQLPARTSPYQPVSSRAEVSSVQPNGSFPGTVPSFGSDPAPACWDAACGSFDGSPSVPGRFWASAEYLLWWLDDTRLPPLATVGTLGSAGILGLPGTTVVLGGNEVSNEERSGGRFRAGYWLDDCRTCGIEGGYFFLGSRSADFNADCPPGGVLARPFFNVNAGAQDVEIICLPGVAAGTFRASLASRLQGFDGNLVKGIDCGCNSRVELLAGFRYLELDEGLGLFEDVQIAPGVPIPQAGTRFQVFDQFDTRNRFYGGQIGARAEVRRGSLFANVRGLVGLGATEQLVQIVGSTSVTPPGGPTATVPAGLLALSTNSGRFERHRFAVVPEVNVNVGYQIAGGLRAFVGYTFLYWSDVVRQGDQIDSVLNVTQIPTSAAFGPLVGPARPQVTFQDTDFWAQGLNFGVEWRY